MHGYGEYKWNDSKYYLGEWDNNNMHGKGLLINGSEEYEGEFIND